MYHTIDTVVFDLGGVLIDWNPEYLYSKIFDEEKEMKYFLSEICTMDWNEQQDGGRKWSDATQLLINDFPQYSSQIQAYFNRWEEMLGGQIDKTVEILERLHLDQKYPLYALTNWSAETFPIAVGRFPFLGYFRGIIVSGEENLKKPDPKIYQLLTKKYEINPLTTLFIDDNARNIEAARGIGFHTIHFTDAAALEETLTDLEILDTVEE